MAEELRLHGHRRHESKQIVIGQRFGLPPFYVDSEGYIYFETENGKEYWLNDKGERVKFREDDDFL
jgi:hypothetical protein